MCYLEQGGQHFSNPNSENTLVSFLPFPLYSFHHLPLWQIDRPPGACFHVVNVLLSSFRKHYVELLVQIAPLVDLCSVWLAGTVQGLTCREHLVPQVNWGRLRWLIALFEVKTRDRRVCVTGKMFCWGRSHQQPGGEEATVVTNVRGGQWWGWWV